MVIYLTENLVNGKKYVGMDSKNNPKYLGSGKLLVKAIKKYGSHNFTKTILEECSTIIEMETRETYWINKFNVIHSDNFYNLADVLKRGHSPFKDKTDVEKKIIFEKIKSKERNDKIGNANRNRKKPEGFGAQISKAKTGTKRSEQTKQKQSNTLKGRVSPAEKGCIVYTKQGELVGKYKSRVECSRMLNINTSAISKVIKGTLQTTGGYKIKNK